MHAFLTYKIELNFFSAVIWMSANLLLCCSSTYAYEGVRFGEVSCNSSGITLNINLESNFGGVVYSQRNFFNPPCRYSPLKSAPENISFFLPLTDCGTLIQEIDGNVYISNTVIVQKYRLVETVSDVVHNISCKLSNFEKLVNEDFSTHRNHTSHYKNNVLESWIDFQFEDNILGKDVPNKLMVGDEFLISIYLKDDGKNKAFQVENCWAYDGETMKESQYVLRLFDSVTCKSSDFMTGFNVINRPQGIYDSMTYAVIKAFKFPNTKNLHVTCSIQVCRNRCQTFCEMPEFQRSEFLPLRKSKRSIPENFPEKSFQERYRLMKSTIKALGHKLMEKNAAHVSENKSSLSKRVSGSENTSEQDVVVTTEEYEETSSDLKSENTSLQADEVVITTEEYEENSRDLKFESFTPDLPKNYENSPEYLGSETYSFNLTNNVIVVTDHEFSFRLEYVSGSQILEDCVSRLKFIVVTALLGLILFSCFIACIGMVLYLRKERKKHQIDNFLLYNYY